MKRLNRSRSALCIAAFVFSGCGGTQNMPTPTNVVAIAHPAHRVSPDRIIYTPADVQIENASYNLDLTNDETTDFVIGESNTSGPDQLCHGQTDYSGTLSVANSQSGGGVLGSNGFAAALPRGAPIGSGYGETFDSGVVTIEHVLQKWGVFGHCFKYYTNQGNWFDVTAYLALAFPIRGQIHYGWAQISVTCFEGNCGQLTAWLTGYAYQTIAGKSIKAGEM